MTSNVWHAWVIEAEGEPRLDRYLARCCPQLSRARIQTLIEAGLVTVNGIPTRASYRPAAGDRVELRAPPPEAEPLRAPASLPALDILYADTTLLAINKAPGVVVHPGAGNRLPTLVDALLAAYPQLAEEDWPDPERPGIVHRLDKDTSGVLLVARTRAAQCELQAQFKVHTVQKTYLALLLGRLEPAEGLIDAPLGRHPTRRIRRAVLPEGRPARTRYRVIEQFDAACYVRAEPLTGRTHQIRVHFAALGHAVVGDPLYAPRKAALGAPRQMLHAWRIALCHPVGGEPIAFEAPPPADFLAALAALGRRDFRPC